MTEVWELPLNTNEKMVLLAISDHANDEGKAYPSWDRILQKTSIGSKSTITKIVKILEAVGLLSITKRGDFKDGRKTNLYTVHTSNFSKSTHLELKGRLEAEREKHKRPISTPLERPISTPLEPAIVHPSNSNRQLTVSSFSNRQSSLSDLAKKIISDLNEKAGTRYRHGARKTKAVIQARVNDGYKLEDFIHVNTVKIEEWKGSPKMEGYIRPETLYGPKFEGYLNQPMTAKPKEINRHSGFDKIDYNEGINADGTF